MLAIVADDLTGALDAAAPFAARGMHVEVALVAEAIEDALRQKPDVLSINLGSRELSGEVARQRAAAVLATLPSETLLFKKVDSRLKGNIAAELDSMPFRSALVAPAIPAFGRYVTGGYVRGFGVDAPISVHERLGRHADRSTIPDVASAAEMRASLEDAERNGVDLLIGARGLAEALAERMTNEAAAQAAEISAGPALFVIGSRDPITLAQIDVLRRAIAARYLAAPNGRLIDAADDGSAITLVQAVPGEGELSSEEVSEALADSVCPNLARSAGTMLLSGGATAEAVLKRMDIQRFRLLGECLPGLGLAEVEGRCIIAKSGGFGSPDTLKQIADATLHKMGT
ncbi:MULTISPECIES: four-carbon acid sugar kinase family protein [unclassified Ensifer]|uniref:four-carbon acid sugar kinase family protein n=1 Tax=unclassified Ensifer TaxID=2633371 RepID=UPI00081372CD|nr:MULTISPECIES: four-carbon acid sugar kinase family protein [unclassified Ensifer]OCP10048.1 Hrp-dependent type III effector protein [Ensifer sp. LC14]OCP12289.1 Hrp-dependent type III effector protein [Ensifer sp. LC13]OCP13105.1 Hrp-dependent type III effector protein [Ensifer sp. LC11]OCP33850.1 Hrp-dependent type III effector protein [Ensifer sp. LC499]